MLERRGRWGSPPVHTFTMCRVRGSVSQPPLTPRTGASGRWHRAVFIIYVRSPPVARSQLSPVTCQADAGLLLWIQSVGTLRSAGSPPEPLPFSCCEPGGCGHWALGCGGDRRAGGPRTAS